MVTAERRGYLVAGTVDGGMVATVPVDAEPDEFFWTGTVVSETPVPLDAELGEVLWLELGNVVWGMVPTLLPCDTPAQAYAGATADGVAVTGVVGVVRGIIGPPGLTPVALPPALSGGGQTMQPGRTVFVAGPNVRKPRSTEVLDNTRPAELYTVS
jgi:hypothetical protein